VTAIGAQNSPPATRWLLFWRKASAISAVEPFERVDPASILQNVCVEFTDVGFDVRHTGPDRIIAPCKPLAIMRAITNLCDNGVKFGNAVEVRLDGAELGYNIIVAG
jgi:signal transduction histidine kinase